MSRTLEAADFRVDRAVDGRDLTEPWRFAGCLIAARLGDPAGDETVAELRRNGVTAPIVVLIGWSDWGGRDGLMNAGADLVLLKPCGGDEIVGAFRRLLERSHPEVSEATASGASRRRLTIPIVISALIALGVSLTVWLLQ